MQQTRYVQIEGQTYPVLISDEREALLAAYTAGGAVVGLWDPHRPAQDTGPAAFLVEDPQDADGEFLECVVRRRLGLPWIIAQTGRLILREICGGDIAQILQADAGHGFDSREALEAYIRCQYPFFGFGIWAVTEQKGGALVGLAGVTLPRDGTCGEQYRKWLSPERSAEPDCGAFASDEKVQLEMGYLIFPGYRRRGYAKEACLAVMEYALRKLQADCLLLRIAGENLPSLKLAAALGFERIENV